MDMIEDEVMQCDIHVRDPQYSSYRASSALSRLEGLGREYRCLHQKHFGFAKHVLRFFTHGSKWGDNPHMEQFRNAVKAFYPNLLASLCPML